MKFRLGNCHIFVSPLFTGMITIMLLIDQTGMMGVFLGAVLLHELGHVLFMIWFGCLPNHIQLLPFEINIIAHRSPPFRWQRILLASGGILAGLIVGIAVRGEFGIVNLFLAGFNSLPIFSMDGYQIIWLLLGNFRYGRQVLLFVSWITMAIIAAIGSWLLVQHHNPLLLLFCIYMSVLQIRQKRQS